MGKPRSRRRPKQTKIASTPEKSKRKVKARVVSPDITAFRTRRQPKRVVEEVKSVQQDLSRNVVERRNRSGGRVESCENIEGGSLGNTRAMEVLSKAVNLAPVLNEEKIDLLTTAIYNDETSFPYDEDTAVSVRDLQASANSDLSFENLHDDPNEFVTYTTYSNQETCSVHSEDNGASNDFAYLSSEVTHFSDATTEESDIESDEEPCTVGLNEIRINFSVTENVLDETESSLNEVETVSGKSNFDKNEFSIESSSTPGNKNTPNSSGTEEMPTVNCPPNSNFINEPNVLETTAENLSHENTVPNTNNLLDSSDCMNLPAIFYNDDNTENFCLSTLSCSGSSFLSNQEGLSFKYDPLGHSYLNNDEVITETFLKAFDKAAPPQTVIENDIHAPGSLCSSVDNLKTHPNVSHVKNCRRRSKIDIHLTNLKVSDEHNSSEAKRRTQPSRKKSMCAPTAIEMPNCVESSQTEGSVSEDNNTASEFSSPSKSFIESRVVIHHSEDDFDTEDYSSPLHNHNDSTNDVSICVSNDDISDITSSGNQHFLTSPVDESIAFDSSGNGQQPIQVSDDVDVSRHSDLLLHVSEQDTLVSTSNPESGHRIRSNSCIPLWDSTKTIFLSPQDFLKKRSLEHSTAVQNLPSNSNSATHESADVALVESSSTTCPIIEPINNDLNDHAGMTALCVEDNQGTMEFSSDLVSLQLQDKISAEDSSPGVNESYCSTAQSSPSGSLRLTNGKRNQRSGPASRTRRNVEKLIPAAAGPLQCEHSQENSTDTNNTRQSDYVSSSAITKDTRQQISTNDSVVAPSTIPLTSMPINYAKNGKQWMYSPQHKRLLYGNGQFVADREHLRTYEESSIPIWQIWKPRNLLQKYFPVEVDGRCCHQSSDEFRLFPETEEELYVKYQPIIFDVLCDNNKPYKLGMHYNVVGSCPYLGYFGLTAHLLDNFIGFLQRMAYRAMLGKVKNDSLGMHEKEHDEGIINKQLQEIVTADCFPKAFPVEILLQALQYPRIFNTRSNMRKGALCCSCERLGRIKPSYFKVLFGGDLYDPQTFSATKQNILPKQLALQFCRLCKNHLNAFHRVVHYKFWLFVAFRIQLQKLYLNLKEGGKYHPHDVFNFLTNDKYYNKKSFYEFQAIYSEGYHSKDRLHKDLVAFKKKEKSKSVFKSKITAADAENLKTFQRSVEDLFPKVSNITSTTSTPPALTLGLLGRSSSDMSHQIRKPVEARSAKKKKLLVRKRQSVAPAGSTSIPLRIPVKPKLQKSRSDKSQELSSPLSAPSTPAEGRRISSRPSKKPIIYSPDKRELMSTRLPSLSEYASVTVESGTKRFRTATALLTEHNGLPIASSVKSISTFSKERSRLNKWKRPISYDRNSRQTTMSPMGHKERVYIPKDQGISVSNSGLTSSNVTEVSTSTSDSDIAVVIDTTREISEFMENFNICGTVVAPASMSSSDDGIVFECLGVELVS